MTEHPFPTRGWFCDRVSRQTAGRQRQGEQLQEILEQAVARAEPGTLLPSERELAERYGVARMTVRTAIGGLVYRLQGQGTFVAQPRITQPAALTSFSEDMTARGMTASPIVLAHETVGASSAIARALKLPEGAPIVRLERVRCGDGQPIAVERAHLPAWRFRGVVHATFVRCTPTDAAFAAAGRYSSPIGAALTVAAAAYLLTAILAVAV
jgi:DNA-binding GntR family transcriptional regulator